MARPEEQDPAFMLAVLFGIEGAEVLKFVEDEENDAFAILIETPLQATSCPTCGGDVVAEDPVTQELPATTAGPKHLLIAWKRRQWRCSNPTCSQEPFAEQSDDVDAFIKRVKKR
jgi:hypothetical protein